MLKYIKHHMSTIDDISIFPVLSFIIFGSIFLIALFVVFTKRKSFYRELEQIPLQDGSTVSHSKIKSHEEFDK